MERKAILVEACGLCPHCNQEEELCLREVVAGGDPVPIEDRTKISPFCPLPDLNNGEGGYYCSQCMKPAYIGIFSPEGFLIDILCPECFSSDLKRISLVIERFRARAGEIVN